MNAVDEQTETIEHLDFQPALRCEVVSVAGIRVIAGVTVVFGIPCKQPAAWVCICRACGKRSLSCSAHLEQAKAVEVSCDVCMHPGPLHEVFIVEPLAAG